MPRVPKITRHYKIYDCTVIRLNIETGQSFKETLVVPAHRKTEKSQLAFIKEAYDSDTVVTAKILSTEYKIYSYKMSEADFLRYATKVDE